MKLWSLLLAVLCGCARSDGFPQGFLFGTAIAGFQVEMGCPTLAAAQCEDRAAGELHGNALRLSIEWSRVFPVSTIGVSDLRAVANASAVAYYHAVFAAMKARGLKPLVTLNHYTLPAWLHDAAGCPRVSLRWAEAKAVYGALVSAHARMFDAVFMTFNPFSLALTGDAAGIGEALDLVRAFPKPIYITETGIEDPQDTGLAADWIGVTLRETRRAMDRGADVRGYFYWTLMDNYEWNHGMTMKLGRYGVDPADPAKARTPRPRAIAALATAARTGRAPPAR